MLSIVLGVVGLLVALYQIRKVERAALAAKRAAETSVRQINTYALLLAIPELVLIEREIESLAHTSDAKQTAKALRDWQARASELVGLLKEQDVHEDGLGSRVQNSIVLAATARTLIAKGKAPAEAARRFRSGAEQVVNLARQEGARIRADLPAPEPVPSFTDDCRQLWRKIRGAYHVRRRIRKQSTNRTRKSTSQTDAYGQN